VSKVRVLVAEDDTNIRDGLVDTLVSDGYEVDAARDGGAALALFGKRRYDLVILDIMMPEKSGYDVCREIRAVNQAVPVLMLTAKGEEADKVIGLRLGADDYVSKPFGVRELLARIAALLRRSRLVESGGKAYVGGDDEPFVFGPATVDPKTYRLAAGRRTHELSEREVRLIKLFRDHPDEVLSRDRILNAVWGVDYFGTTRTLDQHIAKLRKKLAPGKGAADTIETIHGVGYRYLGRRRMPL